MYKLINNNFEEDYKEFFEELKINKTTSIDTETTGLDPFTNSLKLLQVKTGDKIYIFEVEKITNDNLKKIINDINTYSDLNILHNAKFDLKFLFANTSIWLKNVYCTQVGEFVGHAGLISPYCSLEELVFKYCNVKLDKDIRKEFYSSPYLTEEMLTYSAIDVQYLRDIWYRQQDRLIDYELSDIINLEMALLPVVARMEFNGINLDVDAWTEIYTHFGELREIEEKEIREYIAEYYLQHVNPENALNAFKDFGIPIVTKDGVTPKPRKEFLSNLFDREFIRQQLVENLNIGSHSQLKAALEFCGVKVPDTNVETLNPYREENELVKKIITFKVYKKLSESYGANYIERINPVTKKLHPEFNQVGTETGRFSSNFQQIPVRNKAGDDYAKRYRNCIVASPGHKILGVDYSGMEYRFSGELSGDESIIKAFQEGKDLHQDLASLIYEKDYDDVKSDERTIGKTINFSMIYGSTAHGINKKNPQFSIEQCMGFVDGYNRARKTLVEYSERIGKEANDNLMIRTKMGRVRFFKKKTNFNAQWEIKSYHNTIKRQATSTVVSGTCADCVKMAMIAIDSANPFGDKLKMIIQIHDELVFEVADDVAEAAKDFVVYCMLEAEKVFLKRIPAAVNPVLSDKWEK